MVIQSRPGWYMNSSNTLSKHARWMKLGMQAYLFPGYKRFREKVIELSEITPSSVVLDFGCGVGLLEEYLKGQLNITNGKITGADAGEELIKIAKTGFADDKRFEFVVIDKCGNLPFPNNKFDIIISNLVFHLLNREQKEKVLKEFKRILKPEGHILLAEIGKPEGIFGYWIKFLTLKLWARIWPYEVNSIDSFNGLLHGFIYSAGFTTVRTICKMKGYIDFIYIKQKD